MSFIDELKRRNVFRVGVAYVIVAWLLLQVADVVLNNIEAATWVFQAILLVLVIGFPLSLFFAWAYELTPEGLKKEKDIDRSQSITHVTGRKLDFVIIGLLAVTLAYFAYDKFVLDPGRGAADDKVITTIAVLPQTIKLVKRTARLLAWTITAGKNTAVVYINYQLRLEY
jgi:hypothetical protein